MKIKQISVFLENRRGRLYEVCSLLGENNVNIRALTIAETESFGVLRVVVDKTDEAVRAMELNNFTANVTEVVAVEVTDEPGGLANVLKVIAEGNLNIEYMYGFVEKHGDKALLVFRFENADRAVEVLTKNGIKIVGGQDVKGL